MKNLLFAEGFFDKDLNRMIVVLGAIGLAFIISLIILIRLAKGDKRKKQANALLEVNDADLLLTPEEEFNAPAPETPVEKAPADETPAPKTEVEPTELSEIPPVCVAGIKPMKVTPVTPVQPIAVRDLTTSGEITEKKEQKKKFKVDPKIVAAVAITLVGEHCLRKLSRKFF